MHHLVSYLVYYFSLLVSRLFSLLHLLPGPLLDLLLSLLSSLPSRHLLLFGGRPFEDLLAVLFVFAVGALELEDFDLATGHVEASRRRVAQRRLPAAARLLGAFQSLGQCALVPGVIIVRLRLEVRGKKEGPAKKRGWKGNLEGKRKKRLPE